LPIVLMVIFPFLLVLRDLFKKCPLKLLKTTIQSIAAHVVIDTALALLLFCPTIIKITLSLYLSFLIVKSGLGGMIWTHDRSNA